LADGPCGLGSLVQKIDDLEVERIDFRTPVTDFHHEPRWWSVFSPREYFVVLRADTFPLVRGWHGGDWPQSLNKLGHCRGRVLRCGLLDQSDDGAAGDGGGGGFSQ